MYFIFREHWWYKNYKTQLLLIDIKNIDLPKDYIYSNNASCYYKRTRADSDIQLIFVPINNIYKYFSYHEYVDILYCKYFIEYIKNYHYEIYLIMKINDI